MAEPDSNAVSGAMHWDTLGTGADLWATVVMASGFVLPAGQEVREHYRIVKPLGEGGMGQVLGVVLLGSADLQTYALKMVARPLQGDGEAKPMDAADRRDAEVQAKAFAALLRGEAAKQELVQRHGVSVARLFALVRFEDGALGLRMEIARGRSLEAIVADEARNHAGEAPDLDGALVVMRKLFYQLRRLHELVDPSSPSGFVHSDIKPGNVFIDDGDRYDPFVTLLDFGVSTAGAALDHGRATFASGRKTLILNDAGGTFGFAPPHHFTGKPTPLSDVFAALVILFELITLQSPWNFDGLAKSPANVFKLEAAMRKGCRPVRAVRPSVPADVADVLDRFFAEEFRALHELADAAHEARSGADLQARREMSERLRTLAKTYQTKIEALRVQVRGGDPLSDPGMRLSAAEISAQPAPIAVAKPPPVPPRRSAFSADAAHADVLEAERLDSKYIAGLDEPVRIPTRPLIGWKLLSFVTLLGAAGAYAWINGVPPAMQSAANSFVAWTADGGPAREQTTSAIPVAGDAGTARAQIDSGATSAIPLAVVDVLLPSADTYVDPTARLDSGVSLAAAAPALDADFLDAEAADVAVVELAADVGAGPSLPTGDPADEAPIPQPAQGLAHAPVPEPAMAASPRERPRVMAPAARVAARVQPARSNARGTATRNPAQHSAAAHNAPARRRAPVNAHRRPPTHPVHRGTAPRTRSVSSPRRR